MWLYTVVFAILSFAPNVILLAFYFSSIIIASDLSRKLTLHKYGFVTSFAGTSAGALFSLLIPLLPGSIPWMDINIVLVVVIWLYLTKHYTQMGWLGSFLAALIGALLYIFVLAIVSGFLMIFSFYF